MRTVAASNISKTMCRVVLPRVKAALPNEPLRLYFKESFLASAWYDAFALEALLVTAANVSSMRFEDFLTKVFETQAERDQRGVYKLLLRAISPEMLVNRLPKIGTQLFNFTRSEVQQLAPGHWHNVISGVPDLLRTVYCASSGAFVSRALRTTGATDLQHRWLEPRQAPRAHGLAVSTLVRELTAYAPLPSRCAGARGRRCGARADEIGSLRRHR